MAAQQRPAWHTRRNGVEILSLFRQVRLWIGPLLPYPLLLIFGGHASPNHIECADAERPNESNQIRGLRVEPFDWDRWYRDFGITGAG
jgi:hypothetical protein